MKSGRGGFPAQTGRPNSKGHGGEVGAEGQQRRNLGTSAIILDPNHFVFEGRTTSAAR